MADLVTLAKVKEGLIVDTTDDDARLDLLITAASNSVVRYLKEVGTADFLNWSTKALTGDVPEDVQIATIMLVGYLYREPDGDTAAAFEHGYLPMPVMSLIYARRDPAAA